MKQLACDFKNDSIVEIYSNHNIVRSVSDSQDEIIGWIIQLYCPNGFSLDPTYSKGNFYKHVKQPVVKSDVYKSNFSLDFVSDVRYIPLRSSTLESVMFDPPFLATQPSGLPKGVMIKRFSLFKNMNQLLDFYKQAVVELSRVLKKGGILVFKCQDQVSSGKQYIVHNDIINMAKESNLECEDIFLLTSSNRLINKNQTRQFHSRKYHSYFLVFVKRKEQQ